MKPNQESENDKPLDKVLGQWVVDAPLPARFQEQVWQRISRAEARQPATSLATLLTSIIEVALPQPKFACLYLAALLILGVAGGSWAAQRQNSRLDASLGSRYLQSIDPYQTSAADR